MGAVLGLTMSKGELRALAGKCALALCRDRRGAGGRQDQSRGRSHGVGERIAAGGIAAAGGDPGSTNVFLIGGQQPPRFMGRVSPGQRLVHEAFWCRAATPTACNTSRPRHRLCLRKTGGWYLIDFAHTRHANPARIPVSPLV